MNAILVRSPNWIGDQALAFPFFHYLRGNFPKSYILVVCVPWVESVQFRNLVNEVYVLDLPRDRGFYSRFVAMEKAGRELREMRRWDLGISLPNSFSSAWILYRAGCRSRRGFAVEGRSLLLNQRLQWSYNRVEHRAESYLKLLPQGSRAGAALDFWGKPAEDELNPAIPGVLPGFDPETAWPDIPPFDPPKNCRYWVLAPGSTAQTRRWPEAYFADCARRIRRKTGWTGIVVGGPAETPLAMRLSQDESLGLEDWTGLGPVSGYWKIFRGAQLALANDSGLAHLASLCGCPVYVSWGAGDPRRTKPLGPGRVQLKMNPVDCWPCERNVCARVEANRNECILGISSETLWKEIENGIW